MNGDAMNIPERGLGRGLSSLLSSAMENSSEEPRKLALTQLVPGKNQPRKHFDNNALGELAASIRNQGVIQPLLVRLLPGMPQRYEIVAGERRWRAARMAGLTEVPVIVTGVHRQGSHDRGPRGKPAGGKTSTPWKKPKPCRRCAKRTA